MGEVWQCGPKEAERGGLGLGHRPYHEVFHDSPQPLKLGSMPQQYYSTSLTGCFVAG